MGHPPFVWERRLIFRRTVFGIERHGDGMEQRLQVGVVTATHGLKGEVKVFPTTDDPNRFRRLKEVILDTGREERVLEIEGVKFFKQMVILKFKGFDDIGDVEKFRRGTLFVTRENAVKLGTLQDVISTGANDVYDVRLSDGRQLLIPAIRECILSVDVEEGRMRVHLLDGLL